MEGSRRPKYQTDYGSYGYTSHRAGHLFALRTSTEAEFLEVIGTKLKSFPPCYSLSHLLKDYNPPPPTNEQKRHETGLYCKHFIRKPQVWEPARLCPETSTKLYVHEFGFSTCGIYSYISLILSKLIPYLVSGFLCVWPTTYYLGMFVYGLYCLASNIQKIPVTFSLFSSSCATCTKGLFCNPEEGVLKILSLAKLSRLRDSWLRFGLASAGYRRLGVYDRPVVYTAG